MEETGVAVAEPAIERDLLESGVKRAEWRGWRSDKGGAEEEEE
jgi:hypothetical protein